MELRPEERSCRVRSSGRRTQALPRKAERRRARGGEVSASFRAELGPTGRVAGRQRLAAFPLHPPVLTGYLPL